MPLRMLGYFCFQAGEGIRLEKDWLIESISGLAWSVELIRWGGCYLGTLEEINDPIDTKIDSVQ